MVQIPFPEPHAQTRAAILEGRPTDHGVASRTLDVEDDVGVVRLVEEELFHDGARLVVEESSDAWVEELLVVQTVHTDRLQLDCKIGTGRLKSHPNA